jgi:hypothetical protein
MPNDLTRFQLPALLNFSGKVRFDLAETSPQRVTAVKTTRLSEILMTENMVLSPDWELPVDHREGGGQK